MYKELLNEHPDDKKKYVEINDEETILPVALECGSNSKRVRRLAWGTGTLKIVKWYRYTKKE